MMGSRQDQWEIAAFRKGIVTAIEAKDAGIPAVEVRKLAAQGAIR